MNISVTAKKDQKTATVEYDFGDNLQDAVEKFGEETVFSNFIQSAKISLQAIMRRVIASGGDVQKTVSSWKPGIQLQRKAVPAKTVILNEFKNMSEEERAAFIAELRASA